MMVGAVSGASKPGQWQDLGQLHPFPVCFIAFQSSLSSTVLNWVPIGV
jgi:hypothetical protein